MTQPLKKEKMMKQADKLIALRAEMVKQGVNGFLVPRADEYQNEYVPERAERLSWLTGFTGSAGSAVILEDKAMVQSDHRYEQQIVKEIDPALYATTMASAISIGKWIVQKGKTGQVIGYDPKLHTLTQLKQLEDDLQGSGMTLKPLPYNLLDAVWEEQPGVPMAAVEIFPENFAGRSAREKREEIGAKIAKEGGVATVLTLPDSIAWLLNIRGDDIPHTPLPLANAIVHADGMTSLFIPKAKVPDAVRAHLGNQVALHEPEEFEEALKQLGKMSKRAKKPVLFDDARSSVWCRQALEAGGADIKNIEDPCIQPKARKTPEEQAGMRDAHVRDGIAVTKFLAWLDREGSKQSLTELDIADRLEEFRKLDPTYRDGSFDTIAGWGPNGASMHYRATLESHATITPPGILLLDSGGQYANGTTDITRTMVIGTPTAEMKRAFTLVLKGHISIASAVMVEGMKGSDIDILGRMAMLKDRKDFDHGVGHGVAQLGPVHQPGVGISSRSTQVFKPGMVVSNEPGFYQKDDFGIRIESLVVVQEAGALSTGKKALKFETITVVPIDKRLIDIDLMTRDEIQWLDEYHARVEELIAPHLNPDERTWLKEATAPLKRPEAAAP